MTERPGDRGKVVLEAFDVTKSYARRGRGLLARKERSAALAGISLKVRMGEICAVVGESGSGKSTLGRLLLGLEAPDTGRITFEGTDVATMSREQQRSYRRAIQVVLQDPSSSLNPRLRIGAIIAEPLAAVKAIPPAEFPSRIIDTLEKVGLPADAQFRYPHQFSGGQKQRIAIARAIVVNPRIVVMDEPVSSLDVSVAAQILELVVSLRDNLDMGLLLISHNLGHVWQIAQEVTVMKAGRIVEQGPVRRVFRDPADSYTRSLLDAVPRIAFERP